MVRKIIFLLALLNCFVTIVIGQEPFQNMGNLKVHENGALGFHDNLINNGSFDDNSGLVGFFNDDQITVSGAFKPIFRDLEIMVTNNLVLEIAIGVTNNSNFILGNIFTPRNQIDINVDYINSAFYNGNENSAKIDGYGAITNKAIFNFPIGDDQRLRGLHISSTAGSLNAKTAYFYENIGSSPTIDTSFITMNKEDIILNINTKEFWDLDSETTSLVRLTWDDRSTVQNLVNEIENIRVIGWHTEDEIWKDLGHTSFQGDFNTGWVQSKAFVPDEYTILTLGGGMSEEDVTFKNKLLTPNNDGINDFFVIEAIAISPNNTLKIFNRWGKEVYAKKNYSNTFDGKSNVSTVIQKNNALPSGVYFYVIELIDLDTIHQGYLYIND